MGVLDPDTQQILESGLVDDVVDRDLCELSRHSTVSQIVHGGLDDNAGRRVGHHVKAQWIDTRIRTPTAS